jgi:hypothetical protein
MWVLPSVPVCRILPGAIYGISIGISTTPYGAHPISDYTLTLEYELRSTEYGVEIYQFWDV